MSITSRRTGGTILVQQDVTDHFAWNTVYSREEARALLRQLEALLRHTKIDNVGCRDGTQLDSRRRR